MTPSKARHGVVAMALALAILAYVQRVAISQAAGPISSDLGLGKAEMGLVFGAFGLSYALFEIPMGLIGDRMGVKTILTRLVLAWSFFTALTGAAWNLASMWVVRFLFGAGEAGCFPNLTRMLSQWLPRGERVKAQALMWAATRWGGAATPPLVLLAINLVGWRWAFVLFGLLGAAWVAWFSRRFHERPADHPGVNAAERDLLMDAQALVSHAPESWIRLLLRRDALLLCVQYFCWSYVWYFFVTWLPTYLGEVHGQGAAGMAGLSVLPLLLGGLGSLTAGLLPLWVPRRLVAITSFVSVAVLMALVPQAGNAWVAIALLAAAAFLGDMLVPISWNSCVELGRGHTATMGAAMNMFANFSGFLAPVVGGMLLKASGNDWTPMLWLMAGVAVVGAASWIMMGAAATAPAALEG